MHRCEVNYLNSKMRLKRRYNVIFVKTNGICLSRVLSLHNFDVDKNKGVNVLFRLEHYRKFINCRLIMRDIDKNGHAHLLYLFYSLCLFGIKIKMCVTFLTSCLSRMSYFTCNVQPLEPFSDWFLTRDYETPQETEDPEFRGLATWCNGIA